MRYSMVSKSRTHGLVVCYSLRARWRCDWLAQRRACLSHCLSIISQANPTHSTPVHAAPRRAAPTQPRPRREAGVKRGGDGINHGDRGQSDTGGVAAVARRVCGETNKGGGTGEEEGPRQQQQHQHQEEEEEEEEEEERHQWTYASKPGESSIARWRLC